MKTYLFDLAHVFLILIASKFVIEWMGLQSDTLNIFYSSAIWVILLRLGKTYELLNKKD